LGGEHRPLVRAHKSQLVRGRDREAIVLPHQMSVPARTRRARKIDGYRGRSVFTRRQVPSRGDDALDAREVLRHGHAAIEVVGVG
jgi:hypothetical protein